MRFRLERGEGQAKEYADCPEAGIRLGKARSPKAALLSLIKGVCVKKILGGIALNWVGDVLRSGHLLIRVDEERRGHSSKRGKA
jgi:hypothetical protein